MRALEFLADNLLSEKSVRINLTGGEPTIHPNFNEFVEFALGVTPIRAIRVVSNMSMRTGVYELLADASTQTDKPVLVVASYHWQQAVSERFLRNLKTLLGGGVQVQVKLMLDAGSEGKIAKLLPKLSVLHDSYINLAVSTQIIRGSEVSHEFDLKKYSTRLNRQIHSWRDVRLVETNGAQGTGERELGVGIDDFIKDGNNRFKGWQCSAGDRSLFIDNDGNVHAALCKPQPVPLGNVFRDDGVLSLPSSVCCPHEICECASTVRIPKRAC